MSKFVAISIYVDNLEAAQRFYEQTLGFSSTSQAPGMVELRHDGVAVVLCEGPPRPRPAYPAGVILGVPVTGLRERLAAFKAQGVELVHDVPQPFPLGHFAACLDPSGNAVELLEITTGGAS